MADYTSVPTGEQFQTYLDNQTKFAGETPVIDMEGDSRANYLTSDWLPDGGQPLDIDQGDSGATIENVDWMIENSTIDLSHAHAAIFEEGANTFHFETVTDQFALKATVAGIKYELAEMLPGAHAYYVECYYVVGDKFGTNAEIASLNANMAAKCAVSGGQMVYVDVNDSLTAADYKDPTHLNDAGNAIVRQAIEQAMIANGDWRTAAPEPAHIIGLAPDPFVI